MLLKLCARCKKNLHSNIFKLIRNGMNTVVSSLTDLHSNIFKLIQGLGHLIVVKITKFTF